MSRKTRTAVRICALGLPAAGAAVATALLAPFGAPVAAGLSALVGACAWAKSVQRRSAILPASGRFIGS